eukprot:GEMP01029457.1.p1 GENE.GEMP01029457.1~~GEMP01029457.1.p1  ORF type:complete len:388 (+),score=56.14 GEMP01029457.1:48-1211(+)
MNIPSLSLVGLIAANGLESRVSRRHLQSGASASESALWVIVTLLCVVLIVVIYFLHQLQTEKEKEARGRRDTTYLSETESKKTRWDMFRLRCTEVADGVANYAAHRFKKRDVSQATGSTSPETPCRRESTFPESPGTDSSRRETVGERGLLQMPTTHASNSFADGLYRPSTSNLSIIEPSGRSTSGGRSLSGRRPLKLWDNESDGVRDSEVGIRMPDKESAKGSEFRTSGWKDEEVEKLYEDHKQLKEKMTRLQEELKEAHLRTSASSISMRCRTGSDVPEGQDQIQYLSASPRTQFNLAEISPISNRQREMIMRLMRRIVTESQLSTNLQDELKKKTISMQQLQKQVEYLAAECRSLSSDLPIPTVGATPMTSPHSISSSHGNRHV